MLEFNKDNFKALQAAKATSDSRLAEALVQLGETKDALIAKEAEATAVMESIETKVGAAATAVLETSVTRVKEAFAQGVDKESVIIAMINAESDEKASQLALDAEKSEALKQGGGGNDAWAGIVRKKGK